MSKKIALVMGVANQRSIAWSCVHSFVNSGDWDVIFTYQNDKMKSRVEPLLQHPSVLKGLAYDVNNLEGDFSEQLQNILGDSNKQISAVVHSIAHAKNLKTTPLLETALEDYLQAHEISAYSLISTIKAIQPLLSTTSVGAGSSITALSYLGATKAVPGYNVMGPAKASLESIVRGLAIELAPHRINAISAGPIASLSAKGGIANFNLMKQEMTERAPLGNVTADQVANTIRFLASDDASGITGQTIFVDGGYSIVGGPAGPREN